MAKGKTRNSITVRSEDRARSQLSAYTDTENIILEDCMKKLEADDSHR